MNLARTFFLNLGQLEVGTYRALYIRGFTTYRTDLTTDMKDSVSMNLIILPTHNDVNDVKDHASK